MNETSDYQKDCEARGKFIGLSADEVAQMDADVWRECALQSPAIVEWIRAEALRRAVLLGLTT